ncbi:rhomboid family intramembrane serine protease [bacterium]|nr:rhomboid family intramembrane serine protease [bacterium]
MSIYDRDYYKEQFNPGWGQSPYAHRPAGAGMPPVVKALLIVNVAVFLIALFGEQIERGMVRDDLRRFYASGERTLPRAALDRTFFLHPPERVIVTERRQMLEAVVAAPSRFELAFGIVPYNLFGRLMVWQLLTYQFLHGGWLHLLLNMYMLFMFGRLVERQIGSRSFLRFYLLGGVFAGVLNLLAGLFVEAPTIGASGAICAVLAAFGLMNPNARLAMFIFIFPVMMRARTFVIVYALLTVYFALFQDSNIAHLAHLGGFIFGWLYVYNIGGVRRLVDGGAGPQWNVPAQGWRGWLRDTWSALTRRARGPRVYKGEEYHEASFRELPRAEPPGHGSAHEGWDPRIDDILDKMSKNGVHSLTPDEWDLLDRFRRRGR